VAYSTVSDYLTEASALSQDIGMVRYSMTRYLAALNSGLAEAYRLRPDFFRGLDEPPSYVEADLLSNINFPKAYAFALLLYIVGHVELTDAQGNEDQRAGVLTAAFVQKLRGAA